MIALFFAGIVPAKAAIIIGGLLLLTRRVKSRRDLRGDRLVAAANVRRSIHHRRRRAARAPHPDIIAAVGRLHLDSSSRAQRRDGGAVQPGQQRTGRAGDETVCRSAEQTTTRRGW